jgi:hypothetical protein
MKPNYLSKTVRTILGTRGYAIGLITLLSAIQGMSLVKTAQAQVNPNAGAVCTAAYFDNPGYMYNPSQEQQKALSASPKYQEQAKRADKMMDEITTFSAPLDSPMGYVIKKVNGKEVSIPPNIRRAIDQGVNRAPTNDNRRRVAELNKKYGQYATFGQNIVLMLSPEQQKERVKETYEFLADLAAMMTPEERKAEQDQAMAAPIEVGYCSPSALFRPDMYQTLVIDTGRRPDLDKRLREDKTGVTFFK